MQVKLSERFKNLKSDFHKNHVDLNPIWAQQKKYRAKKAADKYLEVANSRIKSELIKSQ